jgi:alpha-tubulin suppressor-like RCC1 family protein
VAIICSKFVVSTIVFTFGDSGHGQTGQAKLKHQEKPQILTLDNSDTVTSVGAGEMHSFAVTAAGHVYGFGSSQSSQLCCGML